ncbi:hypothetical protein PISMIDRAFT_680770 [Pisolithus microcarpus 441]|uniref:Fungal-type protein kinase domain-containing protein n=1 Tax=Pisolithus microcarpus 441 TaxID=765257 RepID=A0A0C9YBD2_9AGAM|nr:hypothetical protein BKA83DRAFT_680770 [Pisolithus microcarpus]KIK22005.1 hypothetical protein PISMIDRAFT_680770 [Pisolithus microcarpus 441]
MTTYSGRHGRTGTWQFMSAALLGNPGQLHVLEDDIESFVHVLGWTVMSYLPSPMDRNMRTDWVSLYYDDSSKNDTGQAEGGIEKELHLSWGGYLLTEFTLTEPSPILELIRNLASPYRARYTPTEKDKETFEHLNTLVSKVQLDEAELYNQPVHRYQLDMERLNSPEWFLGTIQDALERPGWPAEDRAGDKLAVFTKGIVGKGPRQRAARRVKTDSQLLSASSGPLKR